MGGFTYEDDLDETPVAPVVAEEIVESVNEELIVNDEDDQN